MENILFNTSWDIKLITSSIIVSTLIIASIILMLFLSTTPIEGWFKFFSIFYSILCIFLLLVCYFYSPQGIIINKNDLIIKRIIGNKTISITDIEDIKLIPANTLRGSIRLFGSGGLFGYFGNFRNSELGKYQLFATRNNNYVLVIANNQKYVITLNEPSSLIEKVKTLIP